MELSIVLKHQEKIDNLDIFEKHNKIDISIKMFDVPLKNLTLPRLALVSLSDKKLRL